MKIYTATWKVVNPDSVSVGRSYSSDIGEFRTEDAAIKRAKELTYSDEEFVSVQAREKEQCHSSI